jgi:GTP-binding protein YchF
VDRAALARVDSAASPAATRAGAALAPRGRAHVTMALSCAIVGLPNVGKTTLFNAITAAGAQTTNYAFSSLEVNVAVVHVPDERLELIHRHIATQRIVPADVRLVDIPGLAEGASRGEGVGNKFLAAVKEADAVLHVVRCFERADVAREGPVDPAADIAVLELELAMADLDTVTRNLDRVAKKARAGDKDALHEREVYARAKALLEEGRQLRAVEWKPAEAAALRPLFLLTMKPVMLVANVGDDDLAGGGAHARRVHEHARASGARSIALCCDLEAELRTMGAEDRALFMQELSIAELSLPRVIRGAFDLLGLQTFFTAGEKEIRAWTIRKGDTAPVAAGKIHSDFEKAFIRAEVYSVDDLEQHGSEAAIKAAGKLRVEGKDYVLRDSDVVHFLVGK